MRSSVAFAVAELRAIGRALVDGSWANARGIPRKPAALTLPQALAVMAEAMSFVVDAGVGSVLERGKQMMADLADGKLPADRQPLDFDEPDNGGRK